jgi:hypothetical protein
MSQAEIQQVVEQVMLRFSQTNIYRWAERQMQQAGHVLKKESSLVRQARKQYEAALAIERADELMAEAHHAE